VRCELRLLGQVDWRECCVARTARLQLLLRLLLVVMLLLLLPVRAHTLDLAVRELHSDVTAGVGKLHGRI
jgi:hypothetical protein